MNKEQKIIYMLDNYGEGFDWLEATTNIDEKEWINLWNELGLGIKRFPNTILGDYMSPMIDGYTGLVRKKSGRVLYIYDKQPWTWFDRQGRKRMRRLHKITDLASTPVSLVLGMFGVAQDARWIRIASQPHDEGCETHEYWKPTLDFNFYKDILLFAPKQAHTLPTGHIIRLPRKSKTTILIFHLRAIFSFLSVLLLNFSYFKTKTEESSKEFLLSYIDQLNLLKEPGELDQQLKIAQKRLEMLQ